MRKLKNFSRAIIAVAMMLITAFESLAHDFEVDGIYYNITNSTDKTVAVTFSGSSYSQVANEYSGDVVIPDTVVYNDVIYIISSIYDYAFRGCSGLTSVTISNSVTTIGFSAFWNCSGLTSVTIPNSVTSIGGSAFWNCSGLTSMTIPNSVTSIGSSAFNGCSGLTSVTLGDSLTAIGNYAFSNCTKLTEINLPETLISIGEEAFYECSNLTSINLPNSVTSIGRDAFEGCCSLTSVTIPNSVTTINDLTFKGCTNLKTAKLHDGITSIGYQAFRDCTSLTDIQLPSQLTTIEGGSFYCCSSLTSITIPSSVTTIEDDAFRETGITSIIIPESVKNMGTYIFSNCVKLKTAILPGSLQTLPCGIFYRCSALSEIEIPESVTTIEYGAFCDCSSLTEIELPQQLKSIGESAFIRAGLTTVEIPSSVTTIGKSAFRGTSLKSIVIPETVTSVGDYAFAECSSLKDVTLSEGLTTISQYMFQKCTALENITIPNSVTEIAPYAFDNCTKLKDVKLSENLKTIWYGAFGYCSALEEILLPKSVTTLADANEYTSGAYVGFNHNGVFSHCGQLKKVEFENNSELEVIGSLAFCYCNSLSKINIPNNVNRIGKTPFYCSDSKLYGQLELPSTITSLADICIGTNYKVCKLKAVSPPELTDTTNCLGGKITMIIVPKGSGASYKAAAGWKNYTIVEEGGSDVEVTVTTPGYMAVDIMEQAGVAPAKVTTLKVHGKINQTDFNVMKSNMLNCYSIDLSDAECDSIPDDAFNGKTYLVGFRLPQSCKYIGKNAFKDCSLEEITLPDSVETVSSYAFYGNNIGGDITFPATVKTFGERFISKNGRISSVDFSACEDLNVIPNYAFANNVMLKEVALPYSITTIGTGAFEACSSIEEFTMPNSLTDIYGYAFNSCTNLKSMDFSLAKNLTTIHQYAFTNCTSLKEFAINGVSSLNSIGNYAFNQCTALEYVALPGSLQTLGNYAFNKCSGLKKVHFLPWYIEVQPMSISGYGYATNLETIGQGTFELCTSLETITLPWTVKTIGIYAFNACYALKYADLSQCIKLTTLPQAAFNDNQSLEVVNLPASLTTVNNSAFNNCTKLQNISVAAVTPPTVANANAFTGVDTENCVLSVPTSSYVDYIVSEHWGAFVSLCKGIIVEKDDNVDVYFRHLTAEGLELPQNAQQLASVKTASVNEVSETIEYGALVVDGSSVYAKNNGYIKFILDVAEGYEVSQVLYNDEDVTAQVVNNTYITPAVTVKGTLKVTTGIPAGIEEIETGADTQVEAVEVARYDIHGRLLSAPAKGINIVKYSDGTVKKIIHN